MKLPRVLASSPYAHLLGLGAAAPAKGLSAKAADEELDDEKKEGARRAEDDDDKTDDTRADEGEEEGDKEKKSRKAKSKAKSKAGDEGDDDDDDESAEEDDDKEKAARKSERARCKAIFASAAAGARPDVAAHLAFDTSMSASKAVSMLETVAGGSAAVGGLSQRMATFVLPNPGATDHSKPAQSPAAASAQLIIDAGKQRRGEV